VQDIPPEMNISHSAGNSPEQISPTVQEIHRSEYLPLCRKLNLVVDEGREGNRALLMDRNLSAFIFS
jgi:hypothetical protein